MAGYQDSLFSLLDSARAPPPEPPVPLRRSSGEPDPSFFVPNYDKIAVELKKETASTRALASRTREALRAMHEAAEAKVKEINDVEARMQELTPHFLQLKEGLLKSMQDAHVAAQRAAMARGEVTKLQALARRIATAKSAGPEALASVGHPQSESEVLGQGSTPDGFVKQEFKLLVHERAIQRAHALAREGNLRAETEDGDRALRMKRRARHLIAQESSKAHARYSMRTLEQAPSRTNQGRLPARLPPSLGHVLAATSKGTSTGTSTVSGAGRKRKDRDSDASPPVSLKQAVSPQLAETRAEQGAEAGSTESTEASGSSSRPGSGISSPRSEKTDGPHKPDAKSGHSRNSHASLGNEQINKRTPPPPPPIPAAAAGARAGLAAVTGAPPTAEASADSPARPGSAEHSDIASFDNEPSSSLAVSRALIQAGDERVSLPPTGHQAQGTADLRKPSKPRGIGRGRGKPGPPDDLWAAVLAHEDGAAAGQRQRQGGRPRGGGQVIDAVLARGRRGARQSGARLQEPGVAAAVGRGSLGVDDLLDASELTSASRMQSRIERLEGLVAAIDDGDDDGASEGEGDGEGEGATQGEGQGSRLSLVSATSGGSEGPVAVVAVDSPGAVEEALVLGKAGGGQVRDSGEEGEHLRSTARELASKLQRSASRGTAVSRDPPKPPSSPPGMGIHRPGSPRSSPSQARMRKPGSRHALSRPASGSGARSRASPDHPIVQAGLAGGFGSDEEAKAVAAGVEPATRVQPSEPGKVESPAPAPAPPQAAPPSPARPKKPRRNTVIKIQGLADSQRVRADGGVEEQLATAQEPSERSKPSELGTRLKPPKPSGSNPIVSMPAQSSIQSAQPALVPRPSQLQIPKPARRAPNADPEQEARQSGNTSVHGTGTGTVDGSTEARKADDSVESMDDTPAQQPAPEAPTSSGDNGGSSSQRANSTSGPVALRSPLQGLLVRQGPALDHRGAARLLIRARGSAKDAEQAADEVRTATASSSSKAMRAATAAAEASAGVSAGTSRAADETERTDEASAELVDDLKKQLAGARALLEQVRADSREEERRARREDIGALSGPIGATVTTAGTMVRGAGDRDGTVPRAHVTRKALGEAGNQALRAFAALTGLTAGSGPVGEGSAVEEQLRQSALDAARQVGSGRGPLDGPGAAGMQARMGQASPAARTSPARQRGVEAEAFGRGRQWGQVSPAPSAPPRPRGPGSPGKRPAANGGQR